MLISLVDCLLEYEVKSPTHFLFNIEAAFHDGHDVMEERLTITPSMKVRNFCDERSGNRFVRLDAPRGVLSINYHARVGLNAAPVPLHMDETPVSAIPDDVLSYLMPSRYCESDSLSRVARQLFGQLPTGLGRVRAIENWIHESIDYLPGFTTSTTTAQEVFVQRVGVCRDFAHLGITLCRALNIPAAGFPRRVRGLAGRPLGAVRPDAAGADRPAGADRHRARRQGCRFCHHIRRCPDDPKRADGR